MMRMILKYTLKDFLKNRSILVICSLFFTFVSFLYFFVHFSVDLNLTGLNDGGAFQKSLLSNEQIRYYTALQNNQLLIRNITWTFIVIISFMLFLFVRNQLQKEQIVIGQLLAMGYEKKIIAGSYMLIIACLSVIGSFIGLMLGYYASDILLEANKQTYLVDHIVKGISLVTLVNGMISIPTIFSVMAFFSAMDIDKKEIALLIKPAEQMKSFPGLTEKMIQLLPISDKFKFKLTMKSISAIFFILIAVITFNIMFILSVSLYFSGGKILESQKMNRQYGYDLKYDRMQYEDNAVTDDIRYLEYDVSIDVFGRILDYKIMGVNQMNPMFQLTDDKGQLINIGNGVVLNQELEENYGLKVGDMLSIDAKGKSFVLPITDIAENADLKTIYLQKQKLADLMEQSDLAYNGVLTNQYQKASAVETLDQKISEIERGLTSNKASALINQSIGIITGCLLFFLAILIGLNNNLKSILVFDLLGYSALEIKKILIMPYMFIINLCFLFTMPICIYAARSIQITTSIQTNDYMPFQINVAMFVYMFVILNLLCILVSTLFMRKIREIMDGEHHMEFLYGW